MTPWTWRGVVEPPPVSSSSDGSSVWVIVAVSIGGLAFLVCCFFCVKMKIKASRSGYNPDLEISEIGRETENMNKGHTGAYDEQPVRY